jgi:hypothetical protein
MIILLGLKKRDSTFTSLKRNSNSLLPETDEDENTFIRSRAHKGDLLPVVRDSTNDAQGDLLPVVRDSLNPQSRSITNSIYGRNLP